MKRTVLVIAAHPDDEVLGCGGTIARHTQAGDAVHVLLLSDGVREHDGSPERRRSRLDAAESAAALLKVASLKVCDFRDSRFDAVDLLDLVIAVEGALASRKPDLVYTHHGGDLNVDHVRAHEAVVTACRPFPEQSVRTLLFFEVPSSTGWRAGGDRIFAPNWFVNIERTLESKEDALRAYDGEMRAFPHARSVEAVSALARWRGSSVGLRAAEAFELGRRVTE